MEIAASMMCADFANLDRQLAELESAGVRRLHLDFADGQFVPNLLLGREIFSLLPGRERFERESHLMMFNPDRYLSLFCHQSDMVIVHCESTPDVHACLKAIINEGIRAAVAISPATPAERVFDFLDDVAAVVVMTVEPGFAGGKFIPGSVKKVQAIRQEVDAMHHRVEIEVDGSINPDTIPALAAAGADVFVGGSSGLFTGQNIRDEVRRMRESAGQKIS